MDELQNKNNSNENFFRTGRSLAVKYPSLKPFLVLMKKLFFSKPKFSGWGMSTLHEHPWTDEFKEQVFRNAHEDIKKNFLFNRKISEIDSKNIDSLLWRDWIISYAIRHTIKFAKINEYNFCECGVGVGVTAFVALREIKAQNIEKFSFHLYDAWDAMKKEHLSDSELSSVGRYRGLDINITKKNLSEFNANIIYHKGYVPESFKNLPESPNSIIYLHIDLNSARPTFSALEFFFPYIVPGGVIIFDDYGDRAFKDIKKIVDKFFSEKPGMLLKLPTGQAIYFHTLN